MTELRSDSDEPSRGGCLLAVILILAPLVIYAAMDGRELAYEFFPLLLHGLIVACPFGYLALDGSRSWLPWLVAIGLTIAFWGAYIAVVIASAPGVNFGMILAVLISPFVITGFTWAAARHARGSAGAE